MVDDDAYRLAAQNAAHHEFVARLKVELIRLNISIRHSPHNLKQARIVEQTDIDAAMVGRIEVNILQPHRSYGLRIAKILQNACILYFRDADKGRSGGAIVARHFTDDSGDVVELLLVLFRRPLIGAVRQEVVVALVVGVVFCIEEVLQVVEGNGIYG